MTEPLRSLQSVVEAAQRVSVNPLRLACAAAADRALLRAVRASKDLGLADPVLIGDRAEITGIAESDGISLDGMNWLDAPDADAACRSAVALCRSGHAGALMKGAAPTSTVLKAVLDPLHGLRTDKILSHIAVFEPPGFGRLLLVADAGVNVAPDLAARLQIIQNSVEVARSLGLHRPRIALLAASETISDAMPATRDAAELAVMVRKSMGDAVAVNGPMSLDIAVSSAVASNKGVDDDVAGRADLLIAPTIEVGNVLYKAMTCLTSSAVASLVLGAAVPLVIPSRTDSEASKLFSIALAALFSNACRPT